MSSFAVPVKGAGLGDQQTFGVSGVSNSSPTLSAKGIAPSGLGEKARVYDAKDGGAAIDFFFQGRYQGSHPLNAAFVFGSGNAVTAVSAGNAYRSGFPSVINDAKSIAPTGFDSLNFPGVVIWHYTENGGGSVVFSFDDKYQRQSRLNTPFYFGGSPAVSGITVGNVSRYSVGALIENAGWPIKPPSIKPETSMFGTPRLGESGGVYIDFDGDYKKPHLANVPFYFGSGLTLSATAGETAHYGIPWITNLASELSPKGWSSLAITKKHISSFQGEVSASLGLLFSGSYTNKPSSLNVPFYFAGQLNPWITGFDSLQVTHPSVYHLNRKVSPEGQSFLSLGSARLKNAAIPVKIGEGVSGTEYGLPKIYNLLQFAGQKGFNAEIFGEPWFSGGVKYLGIKGWVSCELGEPDAKNTTDDQNVKLSGEGIEPRKVPEPSVSPRILHVVGINESDLGVPLAQFPPFPVGWLSSSNGTPDIDYWTKYARPEGIDPTENIGYPVVRDKARRVYPPSLLDTGVFGDILIESTSVVITVDGFYATRYSDFSEIRSNRRAIVGRGYDAQLYGNSQLKNKTPSFAPVGNDLSEFGAPAIGYQVRYIYGSGFTLDSYGRAILTQTPSFAPHGFESLRVGAHTATHGERTLEAKGKNSQEIGEVTTWFRVRGTDLEGFTLQAYGKPIVEYKNRGIRGEGKATDRYGRPWISNANQRVEPEGIFKEFAVVHMVGGLRFLETLGFKATKFGERIIPEVQFAYPSGFSETFGQQVVFNHTQILKPKGPSTEDIPRGRWGKGKAYNLTQYIEMYDFVESQLNPPAWPRWTLIENRSKTIGAVGQNKQLFGYATLEHNARVITYKGIKAPETPEFYESGMVAYRVRELPIQGMEPPYISSWARAYNDAFVIAPAGLRADVYGDVGFENTRRYFNYIGAFNSEQFGAPMIADRIRELEFERRYTIAPPSLWMPRVDLYTRYVDGVGEDLSGLGWVSLQIVFRKITPRWTLRHYFGWADVWNVTPELGTRGRAADLYGDSLVRLEWRPMNPDGSNMQVFGELEIADRDRALWLDGIKSWSVSDKLKVIKTGQPPYTDQHIELNRWGEDGVEIEGYGIWPPGSGPNNTGGDLQVPKPIMNQLSCLPEGFKAEKFGTAFAQSNTLIIESGIYDSKNGEPTLTLKSRSIEVDESDDPEEPPSARLSPWTIWARPAPDQARRNHPGSYDFTPVGAVSGRYPAGTQFGRSSVSTWEGDVYPRSTRFLSSRVSKPRLHLHKRYIAPDAVVSYRNGWQSIDGGFRFVRQFESDDFAALGNPEFSRPPYTGPQHIEVRGIKSDQFGLALSEPFNREYVLSGFDSMRVGTKKRNDSPYAWQGLRIGPLMPTIPVGEVMSDWGETWVSYWIRGVDTEGFDAFVSEYELESFEERMRVSLAAKPEPPKQAVNPVELDDSVVGVPNIRLGVHHILPDGNANQYRKGAPN